MSLTPEKYLLQGIWPALGRIFQLTMFVINMNEDREEYNLTRLPRPGR